MGSTKGPATTRAYAGTLPLITTKISVPRRRDDLLPRRRLVDFVHAHLDRKLLLISAPAGYGKTSLLIDVTYDIDLPVCWYTLDAFDRDFAVFLEYFVAAIASRFPAFGERSRTFLRETSDPASSMYPLVATLVQEIYDTIPEYFFLVLDDHHNVEDQDQISTFLDLFATYVDENCHLVLASRTLPALPNLSLLVARRQAAGLSIDELRFTPEEIQGLAEQNYGLELSLDEAGRLADRTGGWITGLLLTTAHHWQKARKEVGMPGRIGIDLYDYLSGQVLYRQPAPLRDFLLASSVLEELDPALCRSALGVEKPLPLMDQLRIRNLFVFEYEGEQDQLRYHDLFREFLRDTLRREDEDRYRELNLRAAAVYEERGEWERAVGRYLALQRYAPVVDIIQRVEPDLFEAGRWDTLAGWIDALPESIRVARPGFLLLRGKIHGERGELDQSLALYEQAEDAFRVARDPTGYAHAVAAKGHVLRFQGRYAEAIARSEEALRLADAETPDARGTRAMAHRNIGLCSIRQGRLAQGQEALQQASHLFEAVGATFDAALVQHDLGLGYELMGDLAGAEAHYRAALQRWRQLDTLGPWANTLNGLGVVYYLQGRYEEASQVLEAALDKAQRAGDLRVEAFVWASVGDVHRDLGAYQRAQEAYSQALEVAGRAHVGFIRAYAHIALGHVARLQGDLTGAEDQLSLAMELGEEHDADYEIGLARTALGILAADRDDLNEAQQQLDRALELFGSGGFSRDLASARLFRAQIAFQAGDEGAALDDLQDVLALSEELGFDQFLVVEGQRLPDLLRSALEQGVGESILPQVLDRIKVHRAEVQAKPEPVVEVEAPPALKIYALGQPRVELDAEMVQWTTTQSRDLFFCLLQHRHGLRKEELGNIFWPEHPPRKLDGIFRSTLYRLRRAVYRDAVVFEDGLYSFRWDCDYWLDIEAFEQSLEKAEACADSKMQVTALQAAVDLYHGDYLEGVYDDWSSVERQRLRERYLVALESVAGLYAERGNLQQAVAEYQQLLVEDPYREPAHRELMHCYYRLGDRAAAIRQYQSCVKLLREELGLSPSRETEELYLQIID